MTRRLHRIGHEVVSRTVERVLDSTARKPLPAVRAEVRAFHQQATVVDLLVGSVLFRREFVGRQPGGHADLPRLMEGDVDLIGLTIATRHPDLRGTLSTPQFRALGFPVSRLRTNMALASAIAGRIRRWEQASAGRLRVVETADAFEGMGARRGPDGFVHAFLGVQGGHVLDGDIANVERLHRLGVRMLALSHVMDNELVGSNTGARRGGLTGLGREVVRECERVGIVVDLAHMSSAGINDTVPLLTRPFLLSHTGFTALNGRTGWRRYSPANRNISTEDARLVADHGGVIGIVLSTMLLGGDDLATVVRTFSWAADMLGAEQVAIGSDFDGGLRAPFDARGLPALTQGLLDSGLPPETVTGVLGGNALRVLTRAVR